MCGVCAPNWRGAEAAVLVLGSRDDGIVLGFLFWRRGGRLLFSRNLIARERGAANSLIERGWWDGFDLIFTRNKRIFCYLKLVRVSYNLQ